MTPPNIQVAFQGGGAKLLAMLPVAHAFQQCERLGRIRVKALAGTSAGAICAALIAANCDFERLRTYIRGNSQRHIHNLGNADFEKLTLLINSEGLLPSLWHLMGSRKILKSLYSDGRALLNESEFGRFLDAILETCELGSKSIESLPKKLIIIATHLVEARGAERKSGSIKQALRDSCALPIAFRSFRDLTINHHVDGGLCDNLPVNSLVGDLSAPIFAVFPEENIDSEPISNLPSYLLTLFSAAIENNVKRAKSIVSEPFQIPVTCHFSTFGFLDAVRLFSDDNWYRRIKEDATEQIIDFATIYGRLETSNQYRFDDTRSIEEYAEALGSITQDYTDHVDIEQCQMVARVNSLDRVVGGSPSARRPADGLTKIVRFAVKSANFRYYCGTVGIGPLAAPSIWRAQNITKNIDLPIRVLSLERVIDGKNKVVLVEFLEPKKHIEVDDEIELTDTSHRKDAFVNLNAGAADYISVSNIHPRPYPTMEVLLRFPRSIGNFSFECDFARSDVTAENVDKFQPGAEFHDAGSSCIGIRARNLRPGGRFYCSILPR